MSRWFLALLSISAVVASPIPAFAAAFELTPGTWQEVETGTEDGKPAKPETSTSCMTAEEAKNPTKGLAPDKEMKGQCKTYDVKETANSLSMRMQCGQGKEFAMDITASFVIASAKSYSGTVKSAVTLGGKTTTSDKKIEAKWIAAQCKK